MAFTITIQNGKRIKIDGDSALIGRDGSCHVSLPDQLDLQPIHAKIRKVADRWMIEAQGDWQIQVGTGLPGRMSWIKPGDVIRLTETGLEITFLDGQAAAHAAPPLATAQPPKERIPEKSRTPAAKAPPPDLPAAVDEWYYAKDGKKLGPCTGHQLKKLAAEGQLAAADLVWKEGLAQWVSAQTIKGLFSTTPPSVPALPPIPPSHPPARIPATASPSSQPVESPPSLSGLMPVLIVQAVIAGLGVLYGFWGIIDYLGFYGLGELDGIFVCVSIGWNIAILVTAWLGFKQRSYWFSLLSARLMFASWFFFLFTGGVYTDSFAVLPSGFTILGILLSIPVGIWAISTLRKPDVTAFFGKESVPELFSHTLLGTFLGRKWENLDPKKKPMIAGGGVVSLILLVVILSWLMRPGQSQWAGGGPGQSKTLQEATDERNTKLGDVTAKRNQNLDDVRGKRNQNLEEIIAKRNAKVGPPNSPGTAPTPVQITLPDFSKIDYSVPFNERDYVVDFSKLDYSKGPKGEPLKTRTLYELHNQQIVEDRPSNTGQIKFRRVSSGFVNSQGQFTKHGVESVYTDNERAILASEELPPNPKFADQNRWKFDSDDDLADGLISIRFAEKTVETYWFNGQQHGTSRGWFPTQELRLQELQLPIAKTTRNKRLPGELQLTSVYVNGKVHGRVTLWAKGPQDPNNLFKQAVYKQSEHWMLQGTRHGPDRRWYEDNTKTWEGWWKDGNIHGKWVYWVPSGRKLELPGKLSVPSDGETYFLNGQLHGVETNWYDAERTLKVSQRTYDSGNILLQVGWWPNGIKNREVVYQSNKEVERREWDENGNLKPPPSRAEAMLKRLARGMTKQDVINFLGQPDARSPLGGQAEQWVFNASETERISVFFDTQGMLRDAFKQQPK